MKRMNLDNLVSQYNQLILIIEQLKNKIKDLKKMNKKLFNDCKEMKRIIYIMADTD